MGNDEKRELYVELVMEYCNQTKKIAEEVIDKALERKRLKCQDSEY